MCGRCNTVGSPAFVITVAIWTIIQSIGYIVMSLLGLLAHSCTINMNYDDLTSLMYFIFFQDGSTSCGQNNAEIADMPEVTNVAARTNDIMLAYFIIHIIWLISSLMLLVGACMPCLGRCGIRVFYQTWLLVTATVLILDMVCTGFFIHDLTQTMTIESTINHLEIGNTDFLDALQLDNKWILPLPAVIMMCTSARGFIFWIVNIVLLIIMTSIVQRAHKSIERKPKEIVQPDFGYEREQQTREQNIQQMMPITQYNDQSSRNRYNDPTLHQQVAYDNPNYVRDRYDYPKEQVSNHIERRYKEPLKGGEQLSASTNNTPIDIIQNNKLNNANDHNHNNKQNVNYIYDVDDNNFKSILKPTTATNNTVDSTVGHPTAPAASPPPLTVAQIRATLNERNSTTNPPDELRSQLPWSYFKSRDDLMTSKRQFTQLREDEDVPPVPVPDYTLHFPKKERPSTNSMDSDGRWTGPEVRY